MIPVIFDLDGTLIHSAPDIHAAIFDVLAEDGIEGPDLPTVIGFIGNGVRVLTGRVMRHLGLITDEAALTQRISARMKAGPNGLTQAYPGVHAALDALKAAGHPLGLCTNKPEAAALVVLADMGLAGYFDVVIGGGAALALKPDPAPLLHAAARLGAGAAIFVGDSEVDAETADRAGLPFLLFTEGYRKTPAEALPHAALFGDFAQLPALVAQVAARAA